MIARPFLLPCIPWFRYHAEMTSIEQKYILDLPTGQIPQLILTAKNGIVTGITMQPERIEHNNSAPPEVFKIIAEQLTLYSQQAHNQWTVSLATIGTPFQQRVWQYLQTIPLGTTQSYGQIAKALSSSARAVGNACRANPFLLVVPCHRVVKKSGIGGFAGQLDGEAVAIKQWLLEHEKQ